MTIALRNPRTLFALSAATVFAACLAVLHSHAYAVNPDLAAWGITCDFTLSIPLLYWFFLVRPGHVRPLTIVPVFVIGVAVAMRVVPPAQHRFVDQMRFVSAPLELVTIWMIAMRARAMRKRGVGESDPVARFTLVARELLGNELVAGAVAFEVATLWYAIFGWQQAEPEEGHSFHRRNDWRTILACLVTLVAFESIGMHLLVMRWSATAAWIVTALDLYGILWLLGDYQALRLRRTTVTDDAIAIRCGIRWNVTIARADVASIDDITSEAQWKRRGVLKIAILDEPRVLVQLREPVVAHGPAGIRKRVEALALLPDDVDAFLAQTRR